jgi:hypothetical protein
VETVVAFGVADIALDGATPDDDGAVEQHVRSYEAVKKAARSAAEAKEK